MLEKEIYTAKFFSHCQQGAYQSAKEIVPLILDLIHPKNVVDVGCANGAWLSVFHEFGIQDILGIDGDYVDQATLMIPATSFLTYDLKQSLQLDRKFDLVVSLEVAEHLPKNCAEIFINSLTSLGSAILFSAAIPFQGGTGHFNEQWPEYWIENFRKKGYFVIDCLREKLWYNEKVELHYAQNIFFFVKEDCLDKYPLLQEEFKVTRKSPISLVHPRLYLTMVNGIRHKLSDSKSIEQGIADILKEISSRGDCLDYFAVIKSENTDSQ